MMDEHAKLCITKSVYIQLPFYCYGKEFVLLHWSKYSFSSKLLLHTGGYDEGHRIKH